jgi:hypothetical protein
MSTLNTVNITNGTDSITVEGAVKGSAKAWVNFNGTGVVAIRASFNVSSITDNGTGDYTVNFTSALVDANYSANATATLDGTIGGRNSVANTYVYSTSSIKVCIARGSTAGVEDPLFCNVSIFR